MTSSSRSIMTGRCSARSPRGRWCLLQGQSWPNVFLLNLRGRCRHLRELSWPDDVVYVASTWTWKFSPRSIRIRPCSAQSTWTMRSSPRPIMTKRCCAQSARTMTSSPRSVKTVCVGVETSNLLLEIAWPIEVIFGVRLKQMRPFIYLSC